MRKTHTEHAVKAWIRRHWVEFRAAEDPEAMLLEACGCITADMAVRWVAHAGYICYNNDQE